MNRRTDSVTALIVEIVINLSETHGLPLAARLLAEGDVPFEIALRVLTNPSERRRRPYRSQGSLQA
jgi:hypothetical protein